MRSLFRHCWVILLGAVTLAGCGTFQRAALPIVETAAGQGLFRVPVIREGNPFIVLTIDDAPSSYTEEIADVLKRHRVCATFFVHTDQINDDDRRAALRRLAADGHELAHHMPYDRVWTGASPDEFDAAFEKSHLALSAYGASSKPYFRPARGRYRPELMGPSLKAYGYDEPLSGSQRRYIMSSFLPWDAGGATSTDDQAKNYRRAERYADQLAAHLFSGAIVVFHDGEEAPHEVRPLATIHGLDRFLTAAQAKGFEVVCLSDALARAAH